MVKVYKCHNFKSQSVVQVTGETVAFFIHHDRLFVATDQCTIEVFTLLSPITKISCFSSTESTVHNIIYSATGNYVSTIESSSSRKTRAETFSVKVYLNWEIGTGDIRQKTSVRLAGKDQTVTSATVDKTCIQVIDIPHNGAKIEDINVCQKTGNLIIVSKEETNVYQLVEKRIGNSENVYLDIVLFLRLEWNVGHITKAVLCEDYVGVLSAKEIHIVKVIYSDEGQRRTSVSGFTTNHDRLTGKSTNSRRVSSVLSNLSFASSKGSLSLPGTPHFSKIGCRSSANASPSLSLSKTLETSSNVVEDEHFVKVNLDELRSLTHSSGTQMVKSLYLKKLVDSSSGKVVEPEATDFRGGGHQTAGELQVITVYHLNRQKTESNFRHLQFIPSYIKKVSQISSGVMVTPLRSAAYSSLVGMSCFVSTDQKGHVYDIWSSTPVHLSDYSYSDVPNQICMNEDLLYVLTARGLEIYTSRCGATAIHHTERFDSKEKAFPPADLPTCLCGVHLFMNTVKLDVGEKYVIVLSKVEESHSKKEEGSSSLYVIEKCSPTELFEDMVRYGEKTRKLNESTYLSLLLEGHMTLRSSFIGRDIPDGEIGDCFKESCLLIGEYYSKENGPDRHLCIPYLNMSGLGVEEVIRRIVDYHEKLNVPEYGQGFVSYLKHILLQDGEPFELIEAEGDMIISVCAKAVPDHLSEIILFSRIKEFKKDNALSLLKNWIKELKRHGEKSGPLDKLAMAKLYLDLCDVELAENSLSLITKVDIIRILTQHHEILHENFQQLSPLSQLIRRCCPNVLTQSLVALHDKGTITMDLAIQLLQGSNEDLYKNTHVKEYLEYLLSDSKRRYIFDEAVVILSEIYIKRLVEIGSHSVKQKSVPSSLNLPIDEGHFGRRYNWLDHLPPFNGPQSMKQPCHNIMRESPTAARKTATTCKQLQAREMCYCAVCFEDLIKLQSLLCSNYTSEVFLNKISAMWEGNKLVSGHDSLLSLLLLKQKKEQATELIVKKFPKVITEYGICMMSTDPEQKSIVLECIYLALKEQSIEPDDKEKNLMESFKDILQHLAKTTDSEEFIGLLPDHGNFLFFLPYISFNLECQKSNELLTAIKDKGQQLQASMFS